MRDLVKFSLLGLCMSGLLLAQHGGGGGSHGGGGFHGGGGGFHSSGSFGGFSRGGYGGTSTYHMSPFASGETGINRPGVTYPTPLGLQPSYSGFSGIEYGAYGNGGLRGAGGRPVYRPPIRGGVGRGRNRGYYPGFLYYPYFGFGYGDDWYDPYFDDPDETYAPPDQYYEPYPEEPSMQAAPAPGPYPYPYPNYPPIPYQVEPQQSQPSAPPAPSPPIVLILKAGQKLEVQNYAIMNGVLWDFTKQNPRRIPLSSIDEAASAKATDDAGGAFPEESFGAGPK